MGKIPQPSQASCGSAALPVRKVSLCLTCVFVITRILYPLWTCKAHYFNTVVLLLILLFSRLNTNSFSLSLQILLFSWTCNFSCSSALTLSRYVLKCIAQNETGFSHWRRERLSARMTETWYQLQPLDAVIILILPCCPPAIFCPWKMKNSLLWAWC